MSKLYSELLEAANKIKVIDTHEHLHPRNNFMGEKPDILREYLSHYITSDLLSAGITWDKLNVICDSGKDVEERFAILEPYLNVCKNTSYYRALVIATAKLYSIYDINKNTIADLNSKFTKLYSNENSGRYIMKEVNNIDRSINDCWRDDMEYCTTDLFVPVWHPDSYVAPNTLPKDKTLTEYLDRYTEDFKNKVKTGMVSLKSSLAYGRTLNYEEVPFDEAEALYKEAVSVEKDENFKHFPKRLSDYVMHHALSEADKIGFVIQIHTGLQEGMYHNIENSNPLLLRPLFHKYPNLTFDIFHMGYPFERELIVLAKNFDNVCIDMCWAHIISPYASRSAFYEMLDVLPHNKIFGFGGDYLFFDGVVGHVTLARENICRVLAAKVEEKAFPSDVAYQVLNSVLRDNAKRIFKI